MKTKKSAKERKEFKRLWELYAEIAGNTRELYRGLIEEAARLKVLCDELWSDIQENGKFEDWQKGDVVYQRERDASKSYRDANRLYQSIIKDLETKLPPKSEKTGFAKIDEDD